MEEFLCSVEIRKTASHYLIRINSEKGGTRDFRSPEFEEVFEQAVNEIQEEFEDLMGQ